MKVGKLKLTFDCFVLSVCMCVRSISGRVKQYRRLFVCLFLLEGGNPYARHHGKALERETFCHGVELSYCLVTVRALTETWYQECEQTLIILLLSI